MQEKHSLIIKHHVFFPYLVIAASTMLTLYSLSWISLMLSIFGFYLFSKKIEINGIDAKYSSWFSQKSIKAIEMVDVGHFPLFSSVKISGRGGNFIRMPWINDVKAALKYSEEIDKHN